MVAPGNAAKLAFSLETTIGGKGEGRERRRKITIRSTGEVEELGRDVEGSDEDWGRDVEGSAGDG